MNEALVKQFAKLISVTTGLQIRDQDRETLRKKILIRMKALKLSVPEQYYQLLEAVREPSHTIDCLTSESEWKELTTLLTTGESYFFRDRGQFKVLKNDIFPDLIKQKQIDYTQENNRLPSLRIWSAGCSTGEEPYSLAILLQEMIPDWQQWNISILGTDLNQEAIEKAKRGIYSPWSFRMVDSDLQQRYFSHRRGAWEIDEKIRNLVNFRQGNLVLDDFPNSGSALHSMDLIICRNVFVYFESKAISTVIEKFYKTLQAGGYLMTAHAELHGQQMGQFKAKVFPESVVYQRAIDWPSDVTDAASAFGVAMRSLPKRNAPDLASVAIAPAASASVSRFVQKSPPLYNRDRASTSTIKTTVPQPPSIPDTTLASKDTSTDALARSAETLFHNKAYAEAIQKAAQVIAKEPRHFGAHYLMARAQANVGEYDKATHSCQQAIQIDSLCAEPYYLLAHLAEERGEIENAKMFYKRIIYLAPSSINAYLELAALYEREGDRARARKMRNAAVELLDKLPADATVDKQSRLKAGELLLDVQKILRDRK